MRTKRSFQMLTLTSLCAVLLCSPSAIFGRTLYVDGAYVDVYAGDVIPGQRDGASWATAFEYLQDALAVASAGDEIRVAQGQYRPDQGIGVTPGDRAAAFRLVDGVTILGGFAGVAAVDPNFRDIGRFATILTGDLAGNDDPNDQSTLFDNSFHVVTADGVSSNTVLDGLTIAHGNAADRAGGGLRNIGASPIVRDCTFLRNRAYDRGGGVMNTDSYAVFVGCTFLENWSPDGEGGGMANYRSHIRIEDCRFIRNHSDDGGGGLYNADGSSEVINCEFVENRTSEYGGGVENIQSRAILFNCVFRANSGDDGPGALASRGDELRLILCRFVDNVSGDSAGAVECGDCNMVAANCTFANNAGEEAGAIDGRSGYVSVKHCAFWGNAATDEPAGGIYCRPGCSLIANSCIFWANRGEAKGGGAIAGYRAQVYGSATATTLEYCCLEGWVPERGGTGNIGDDPLFVAPDAGDFHLKSQAGHWDAVLQEWVPDDVTSPCIDAGDPNSSVGPEPFPNGGIVNMGAYGGTCEASKSWFGAEPCATINAADLNGDGQVDAEDYRLAMLRWPQAGQ